MPLIRYRTGDLVQLDETPCRCGRSFARLAGGILGRADDMLVVRGVNVFPSAIEGVLREFAEVSEFRIEVQAQRSMMELKLLLDPLPGSSPDLAIRVSNRLNERLLPARAVRAGSTRQPAPLRPQGSPRRAPRRLSRRRSVSYWQLKFEAITVESSDFATVAAHDSARREQTQTRACLAGLRGAASAIETFEQVRYLVWSGTRPAACNESPSRGRQNARLRAHRPPRISVEQRIGDERAYRASEPPAIPNASAAVRNGALQRPIAVLAAESQRPRMGDGVVDHVAQVDTIGSQRQSPAPMRAASRNVSSMSLSRRSARRSPRAGPGHLRHRRGPSAAGPSAPTPVPQRSGCASHARLWT